MEGKNMGGLGTRLTCHLKSDQPSQWCLSTCRVSFRNFVRKRCKKWVLKIFGGWQTNL